MLPQLKRLIGGFLCDANVGRLDPQRLTEPRHRLLVVAEPLQRLGDPKPVLPTLGVDRKRLEEEIDSLA